MALGVSAPAKLTVAPAAPAEVLVSFNSACIFAKSCFDFDVGGQAVPGGFAVAMGFDLATIHSSDATLDLTTTVFSSHAPEL